jgi:GTP-binding protein HflX
LFETSHHQTTEKAIAVGVVLPEDNRWEIHESILELKLLSNTAGVEVVDVLIQELRKLNPAYFIGTGKVQELTSVLNDFGAATVIFDNDLTPAQSRNLENSTKAKIIDRTTLILDIFVKHAQTREAKTQVELAQLQYLLPRLTRQWSHLSRQVGGIGTKGPGETQLETDRRLVRNRIEFLRKELKKIDQQRITQRKGRHGKFKISLVGYTNVGKSTIMNLLSGSNVVVENQLFATLDSTTRNVKLDENHEVLLSDTVGFIKRLPHHLIASFKSTLDEVRDADLLLHVVDVSHPGFQEQLNTVLEVLREMKINNIPSIAVFNKLDLLQEKSRIGVLKKQFPDAVFISASRQIQTNALKERIIKHIEGTFVEGEIIIPVNAQNLSKYVFSSAIVTEQKFNEGHVKLKFRCSTSARDKIIRTVQEKIRKHSRTVKEIL